MVSSLSTIRAGSAQRTAMSVPRLDPASALLFVINAAARALDVDAKRAVIESALTARGRKGERANCWFAGLLSWRGWPPKPQRRRWRAVQR